MSEAPGQWKQEQRLLWCRKLLLHSSCGGAAASEGPALLPHPPDPAWGCPGLLALVWAGVQPLGLLEQAGVRTSLRGAAPASF